MEKAEYTKGMWFVDNKLPPNNFGVIARIGDNVPISAEACTPESKDNSNANAERICQCVNGYDEQEKKIAYLLEALKDILQQAGLSTNCPSYLKMKQAIAKAEGAK